MNTFANGLTCSTFVGKTVHFSVAIYTGETVSSKYGIFFTEITASIVANA